MALLSALEVASLWVSSGGPANRAVEWVAIAMGESSLDYLAISSAGAIGLYQIMPFNAAPYGFTVAELYDPHVNSRVAVLMSGGGTNCAAWDSAYRDINASGRYRFLSWPEQGSADWNNLPAAQAELSGHGLSGITDPAAPSVQDTITAAVAQIQQSSARQLPQLASQTMALTGAIGAVGQRGWRP